jgi:hypothetical protein
MTCRYSIIFFVLLFAVSLASWAEDSHSSDGAIPTTVSADTQKPTAEPAANGPIQDNSFLVEEAYNQERGVVQHINTFMRMANSKDWVYTFTQEWPWNPHPRTQLSYTVAASSLGELGGTGFGDIMLNYRYQLVGSGETRVAVAPRISALLPTGDSRYGRGAGGAGVQTNLPVSVVLNRQFVTHMNAGLTIVPRAQDAFGDRAQTFGYNFGESVIWLARPRFNVMLEAAYSAFDCVTAPKTTDREQTFYLSPGIRWAHNFKSGLQIVPGVAVPIGVGPSQGEHGLYVYLSFEHPFGHAARESK